jgi:hypothetical protein
MHNEKCFRFQLLGGYAGFPILSLALQKAQGLERVGGLGGFVATQQ